MTAPSTFADVKVGDFYRSKNGRLRRVVRIEHGCAYCVMVDNGKKGCIALDNIGRYKRVSQ